MPEVIQTVTTYIQQYQLLPQKGHAVVAVSGGADSLCLLHLLHQLCGEGKLYPATSLLVAHLNHQLRGEASDQDAAFVARLAHEWGLPVVIGSVDVASMAQQEKLSLEEAGRLARYRFLRSVAQGHPIAVAHHLDDQVETLLLHWLRGGGINSMIGLQPRQQDIIRPLLAVSRADTLEYCRIHQLVPLEDASNSDPRFLRNRIRHELLPLLETLNPGIQATLLRNAEVIQVDAEWIGTQVDAAWPTAVSSEREEQIQLRRDALLALPLSLQRHLLRRVTAKLSGGQSPLEVRHYLLIEDLLAGEGDGEERTLHLPQQLHIIRRGSTIIFARIDAINPETDQISQLPEVLLSVPGQVMVPGTKWLAQAEIISGEPLEAARTALEREDWGEVWHNLPGTCYAVYIDADIAGRFFQVRTRRPGDRIRPLGMAHEKKIQDVLIDKHIPRVERGEIPLFFTEAHCVWLAGITLDDRVRLTRTTRHIVRLSITATEH